MNGAPFAVRFAAAAEALAGTRFRLHGRDPTTGLDCLGVIVVALAACGRKVSLPSHYTLRRRSLDGVDDQAEGLGLIGAHGTPGVGDVLLVLCSLVQPHLAVALSADRFIHAHAGLGRTVAGPFDPAWTIARHWRFAPFP